MTATVSLREALNKGIASGTFVDTKIVLFSRRGSGRVCGPKALYTNSHVLKSIPYFNDREPSTLDPSDYSNILTVPSYKFSLEVFQRQNLRISTTISVTMNPRSTTITPTAILRTMRTSRSLHRNPPMIDRSLVLLTHPTLRGVGLAKEITPGRLKKEKSSGYPT